MRLRLLSAPVEAGASFARSARLMAATIDSLLAWRWQDMTKRLG